MDRQKDVTILPLNENHVAARHATCSLFIQRPVPWSSSFHRICVCLTLPLPSDPLYDISSPKRRRVGVALKAGACRRVNLCPLTVSHLENISHPGDLIATTAWVWPAFTASGPYETSHRTASTPPTPSVDTSVINFWQPYLWVSFRPLLEVIREAKAGGFCYTKPPGVEDNVTVVGSSTMFLELTLGDYTPLGMRILLGPG